MNNGTNLIMNDRYQQFFELNIKLSQGLGMERYIFLLDIGNVHNFHKRIMIKLKGTKLN